MTQNTENLKAAFALIADFTGADTEAFENEMLARHFDGIKLQFAAHCEVSESEDISDTLSLRTVEARTDFDTRVLGMLGRNKGKEVTASNLIMRYGQERGTDPTTAQMRAALNRLIESGDVDYSGIQRGTKYCVA